MALTSASRSWAVVARRALGTSAVAAVALVALAIPASAHTGKPTADCVTKDDGKTGHTFLKIHLTNYQLKEHDKTPNSIKVTDGDKVLVDEKFGRSFNFEKLDFAGDVDHSFKVMVNAWDDQDLKNPEPDWSFAWAKPVPACVKHEEQPPAPAPAPAPAPQPAPAPPTTTTTVAVGASANLAETGASIAVPLTVGAVLLVAGAGMLVFLRKRRKV